MKSIEELHLDFLKSFNEIDNNILLQIKDIFEELKITKRKIVFIGNGGSAAICSHMAIDYSKNVGIRAIALNDSSLLTCLSNDYNFDDVFAKAIELYCDEGDILVAISSSGRSRNIINAVTKARQKRMEVITLSGFDENNNLKNLGNINVYIKSDKYRIVEIIHEYILHTISEKLILDKIK